MLTPVLNYEMPSALVELKELLKNDDIEKIKSKLEEIQKISQEIGTKMYQQASQEEEKDETKEKKDDVEDAQIVDDE